MVLTKGARLAGPRLGGGELGILWGCVIRSLRADVTSRSGPILSLCVARGLGSSSTESCNRATSMTRLVLHNVHYNQLELLVQNEQRGER
jgi:hypothetical protein